MKIFDGQKGKRCDEEEYLTYTHKRCPRCLDIKAVDQFYRKVTKTSRGWSWDSHCIICRREQCRLYGANNKDARNARLSEWRRKNPTKASKIDARRRLKAKYGISTEDLEHMRLAQGGRCAICERETSRLFVDHCHTKGHIRALLCQTCNTFLGWYEKKAGTIIRFQNYLDAHK